MLRKFLLITQHEVPFVKNQRRLRNGTDKGKCTNKRERRIGLSTVVNPFHAEHDPPDVIGLDNNTAMMSFSHYLIFHSRFFLPVPKFAHAHGSIMLPPRHPRVLARVTRAINVKLGEQ